MNRLAVIISVSLLSGCAGTAQHQRYTWTTQAGSACPATFAADVGACFDVGYVPQLFGGGRAIVKDSFESCMKGRGYRQVGRTTRVREQRSPQLWEWQVRAWPWPENPPASPWMALREMGGLEYNDAVCVMPEPSTGGSTPERR